MEPTVILSKKLCRSSQLYQPLAPSFTNRRPIVIGYCNKQQNWKMRWGYEFCYGPMGEGNVFTRVCLSVHTPIQLAARRSVCLLRSRRRTFLFATKSWISNREKYYFEFFGMYFAWTAYFEIERQMLKLMGMWYIPALDCRLMCHICAVGHILIVKANYSCPVVWASIKSQITVVLSLWYDHSTFIAKLLPVWLLNEIMVLTTGGLTKL